MPVFPSTQRGRKGLRVRADRFERHQMKPFVQNSETGRLLGISRRIDAGEDSLLTHGISTRHLRSFQAAIMVKMLC